MATPEALVKYYDCLKDSFNKIQNKDNAALINAALRPKIREELVKSKEVLVSYLNYIQVFSIVYSDKFPTVCSTIIAPLFKDFDIETFNLNDGSISTSDKQNVNDVSAFKVHITIKAILESRAELTFDFVQSVVKLFPHIPAEEEDINLFLANLKNCLVMCQYLDGESSELLLCKVFERLAPGNETDKSKAVIDRSYEYIYRYLSEINTEIKDTLCLSVINVFTRDFLSAPQDLRLNYLLFYISSLKSSFTDHLLNSLWQIFIDDSKSTGERRSCVDFACSLISRATYISLDEVFKYLDTASQWALAFIQSYEESLEQVDATKTLDSFYALTHSIFYIITQRYREMYEEETLTRLSKLSLTSVIQSQLAPLEACDLETRQRFNEVATLYKISSVENESKRRKRRKIDSNQMKSKVYQWTVPFKETCAHLPDRISPLYRRYYNHRNFTIYRD